MSVRWLVATAVVALVFGVTWTVAETVYDVSTTTALEGAAVAAACVGLPLSWWSFRGQLLDEPAEVAWVTWRRVPAASEHLVSRSADLARLEASFGKGRSNIAVITGVSGAGKTELAASYARARIAEGWPLVAWVNASTETETLAGLLEFADALSLRVAEEGSARACERLRQHPPAGTRPSVIVFDGVCDVNAVRRYLPEGDGWRVLVTSNVPEASQLGTEIALEPLSAKDATAQTELSEEVAETLGRLPVPLAVATATVREDTSGQPYHSRLRAASVLGKQLAGADGAHPAGALGAVLLALADAGFGADPAVRRLLGLLTVLSPGGASRGLLYGAAESTQVDDVLTRLDRWRLLSTRMDGDGVSLHELTRQVVADRLWADHALGPVVADAAELLGRATFGAEQAWDRRDEGDQLIAHIAALSGGAFAVSEQLPAEVGDRVWGLRHWATRQLAAVGDGGRALAMAEVSHRECRTLLGAEHPDTLVAADNLVIAYAAAGRASEGIGLAEETLATRTRLLGDGHPDTLASRYSLAYAHEYAGQPDEAATLYDTAFSEYARVLGYDNPQTVTVGDALARVRALQPPPAARHRPESRPRV